MQHERVQSETTGREGLLGGDSLETLVVVSKVKKFIRDRSGLNTSQEAIDALSTVVSVVCNQAILKAREDGRKTVMGRDIDFSR